MSFSGDLGGIGLTDVFQNVAANRSTGTLTINSRRSERFVRFEEGSITGLSLGVGRGLPLIEHLRERGWVDPAALDKFLARRKRARKSPVQLAIEGGLLDEESAQAALFDLAREQLYEIVNLRSAEFTFEEGSAPARVFDRDQADLGLKLEVGPVLMEGARRGDELERIRRVISSEHDMFVLLEGWDSLDLEEQVVAVAEQLDGVSDVAAIRDLLQLALFDVQKAIADLVHAGVARPCTTDEIDAVVREAMAEGHAESATQILRSALEREPSNHELRLRYSELLLSEGREQEAASQLAMAAHTAARGGEVEEARELYAQAIELLPDDLPLHEKSLELTLEVGDDEELVKATLALSTVYQQTGLADRAGTLLRKVIDARRLGGRQELCVELARIESALGHWDESARLYFGLGESALSDDEAQALEFMRLAVEQDPENGNMSARLEDIETGRLQRRRTRIRRIAIAAAAVFALGLLGTAAVGEITASHRVVEALSVATGDLRDGRGVNALRELEAVAEDYAWTVSGRRADRLADQVANLQLRAIDELIGAGDFSTAQRICAEMEARVKRGDLEATCAALRERIGDERAAFGVLRRVDRDGREPSAGDLEQLRNLDEGRYLAFHLAHLPQVKDHEVRQAMLEALAEIDSPRAFPVLARMALEVKDEGSWRRICTILAQADDHRAAGREPEWSTVYPELEARAFEPEVGPRVGTVLDLLRGQSATPR